MISKLAPPDPRLAIQVLCDLARAHAAAELMTGLNECESMVVWEAVLREFEAASDIVGAYSTASLLTLAYRVERELTGLPSKDPGNEA